MSLQRNQSDSFRFGILPVAEEYSRTRGSQSGSVEDQPQCRGLWHSGIPSARSLSRSPSPPPPSFTQSPSPPRSLVRDVQTSPHRPQFSNLYTAVDTPVMGRVVVFGVCVLGVCVQVCARTLSGLSSFEPPVIPPPAPWLSHFAVGLPDLPQTPP